MKSLSERYDSALVHRADIPIKQHSLVERRKSARVWSKVDTEHCSVRNIQEVNHNKQNQEDFHPAVEESSVRLCQFCIAQLKKGFFFSQMDIYAIFNIS